MADRANVVIFFTDQQRWDSIGAYGGPMNLTPNLDAIARKGVRFESAFTNQPVCGPARGCLLTGQYGTKHGVWKNGLSIGSTTTLAHHLGNAGYETAYIGKWHLAPGKSAAGPVAPEYRGGFKYWEASNVLEFTSHPYDVTIYDGNGDPIHIMDKYRPDAITDRVVNFIERDHKSPFFLMVSQIEPHQQNDWKRMVAPDGYAEKYKNPHVPFDLRNLPGDWQEQLPDYYGAIARLDECYGRVMKTLESQGLAENTIVLFLSDHGCHFRTRNNEYKRSCHDGCTHIPFVASGPGFNRSMVVPELVSLVDVAPTVLDALGMPIPPEMQGKSVMPLVDRKIDDWSNEVLIQVSETMVGRAIRTERWKYCAVAPAGQGGQDSASDQYTDYQMYDLFADPHEQVNLVGRTEYKDQATEVRERLKKLMVEAGEKAPEITAAHLYP